MPLRKQTGAIRWLDAARARELVQHRGHLYLDRLTGITDGVAAILAKHPSGGLSLNNLEHLSPAGARALGRHEGELSLNGLERLSGRTATHLARYRGKLHIHGLTRLTDPVAEAFGRREGFLCLQHVKKLTSWQAELLTALRGPLQIGGLKTIDSKRATVFTARRAPRGMQGLYGLFLPDVATLTDDVTRELVRHPLLALDRVRSVSDRVAKTLASHAGAALSLRGLVEASPAAFAALRANPAIHLPQRLASPT